MPAERVDVVARLDEVRGVGCDGHCADRLFVALMSHVQDRVTLFRAHLEFVVHLRDQGTHRVNHRSTTSSGGLDDFGWRTVGAQHHRSAVGHVRDVVDKDHAERFEVLDHELVVDDFVVAVHRRLKDSRHPVERLDGLFHAGAKSPGGREHDLVHIHPHEPNGVGNLPCY